MSFKKINKILITFQQYLQFFFFLSFSFLICVVGCSHGNCMFIHLRFNLSSISYYFFRHQSILSSCLYVKILNATIVKKNIYLLK